MYYLAFESHNTNWGAHFGGHDCMINDISVYKCINGLDKQNPSEF